MKKRIVLMTVIILALASNWLYIRLKKPISIAAYQKGAFKVEITKREELRSDRYEVRILQIMTITEDKINKTQIIEKPTNKDYVVEASTINRNLEQEIRVYEGEKYFVQQVLVPGQVVETNASCDTGQGLLEWQYALNNPKENIQMYVVYEIPQHGRMFLLMGIMVVIGIFLVWVGYFLVRKVFK